MFRLGLWLTLTLLLLNPKAGRGNPDLSQLIAVGEHRLLDDPSAALRYNLDLLQKSPKDDPDVWLHIAVNVMASYAYLERTDEADALLASIEQQLPRTRTPRWKIQILLQKAAILSFQQKAAEAIQLIDEAIVLSQTSELPLLEARARSHMALLQARTNNKTAAIEQLAQSIRLLRGTEKGVIYFVAMNQIATSFLVLEGHNLSKAVDILNELKAEAQTRGLRFLAHLAAYNLGDVHAELLNEDASIQNFEQAAAYAEAIHDDLSQAYAQLGLVDAYRNRGQLDKARQVLLHAAATFEAHGNKSQAFEVHKNLVTLALDQKKHELAWTHLQAIDQLGLDPKQIGAYSDLNLLRSRYYESLGDTRLALKSLQDHMRAAFRESSQLEHEAAQKFAAQFELERKEQQNILLAQKNEIQQLTIRQNERDATIKTLIILSSCLLLLIVSVAFLRIRKKNREIHRLNQHIKTDVLQRFLPPQMVDDILEGRSSLNNIPHHRVVTVLFSDLCEFTRATDLLDADTVAAILNEFFVAMTDVIFSEDGTIDKFIGDAIMVLFGAPNAMTVEEQALKAARCALKMQDALDTLNERWTNLYGHQIQMRIGLHQGPAVVGSFGGKKRSDYTAVGRAVNLASRVESIAEPGSVYLSEALVRFLQPDAVTSMGLHHLRGLAEPIGIYKLRPHNLNSNRTVAAESA